MILINSGHLAFIGIVLMILGLSFLTFSIILGWIIILIGLTFLFASVYRRMKWEGGTND